MAQLTSIVSRRYAKAFWDLANERGKIDEYNDAAKFLLSQFESAEFRDCLISPRVSRDEKIGVVKKILGDNGADDLVGLIAVVLEKKRENALRAILERFCEITREGRGFVTAEVVTAAELTSAQVEKLQAVLGGKLGKKVEVEQTVDESVIAGIRVKIGGVLYDGTLSSALAGMKNELLNERFA